MGGAIPKKRMITVKKIGIGIVVAIVIFFGVGFGTVYLAEEEEKARLAAETPEEKAQREWEIVAAQKQAERDAYQLQVKDEYFERTGKNLDDWEEDVDKCEFDINWKQHTQTIYKTMSEAQYCPEFRDQLKLACQPEAKEWWTSMLVIWECS